MDGRFLTVNIAAPKGSRPERAPREAGHRIYVGNLPWTVDSSKLEELFSEHGVVVSARVVSDRETGRSRGFGFVEMSSESEMNDAISSLDGEVRRFALTKYSTSTMVWILKNHSNYFKHLMTMINLGYISHSQI